MKSSKFETISWFQAGAIAFMLCGIVFIAVWVITGAFRGNCGVLWAYTCEELRHP
jgi:hypothetical protein